MKCMDLVVTCIFATIIMYLNNILFPGCITLNHPDLLKNSKWTWDYWPVLKTLEFHQPCSESMALRVMKSIKTQKCPTLENIIFKSRSYLLGTVYELGQ